MTSMRLARHTEHASGKSEGERRVLRDALAEPV
jgi:hypothetical protein